MADGIMSPPTETVQVLGRTIPVHPHLLTGERIELEDVLAETNAVRKNLALLAMFFRYRLKETVSADSLLAGDAPYDELEISRALERLMHPFYQARRQLTLERQASLREQMQTLMTNRPTGA